MKFKFLSNEEEFIQLAGYSQSKLLINQESNHISTYDLKLDIESELDLYGVHKLIMTSISMVIVLRNGLAIVQRTGETLPI